MFTGSESPDVSNNNYTQATIATILGLPLSYVRGTLDEKKSDDPPDIG